MKILSVITYYIDKISSPVLDNVFKRGRYFDIYIPRLSIHKLHVLTILTKYFAKICSLTIKVRTRSDPDNVCVRGNLYRNLW